MWKISYLLIVRAAITHFRTNPYSHPDRPEARRGRVHRLRIPGIDRQPCGGTHVRHRAEIGRVKVLRLRSEGKRNPRVEIRLACAKSAKRRRTAAR
jgi:Ser-tRNA(Ala) deacylase AlaX